MTPDFARLKADYAKRCSTTTTTTEPDQSRADRLQRKLDRFEALKREWQSEHGELDLPIDVYRELARKVEGETNAERMG